MASLVHRLTGHSTRADRDARVRVLDGYSSPPCAVRALLRAEQIRRTVWEPAAGLHAIANELRRRNRRVLTTDVHRWHRRTHRVRSFLHYDRPPLRCDHDLVTNPPYGRHALPFVLHALRICRPGTLVCMLLRLSFLEGIAREAHLYRDHHPTRVHVFASRIPRMHRFHWDGERSGSTYGFAWLVWEIGNDDPCELRWISPEDAR